MAIAFDNYASLSAHTTGTDVSYTVGSGSNRLLIVLTVMESGQSATGVTYNSVAMTDVGITMTGDSSRTFKLWYLVAPASGANNANVSFTGGGTDFTCWAASYTGVAQTSPIDASGKTESANPISVSLTSTVANDWAVGGFRDEDGTPTDGTMHVRTASSAGYIDSNSAFASIGSHSLSFTPAGADPCFIIAALIKEAGSPAQTLTDGLIGTDSIARSLLRTLTVEGLIGTDVMTAIHVLIKNLTETLIGTSAAKTLLNGSDIVWTKIVKSAAAVWTAFTKN